jgi:hypothetical protein
MDICIRLNNMFFFTIGTSISVEVARVRNDMLKLNTYFVEFESVTISHVIMYLYYCLNYKFLRCCHLMFFLSFSRYNYL